MLAVTLLMACSRPSGNSSKVTLTFPDLPAQAKAQKISSNSLHASATAGSDYDWSLACFAVNIKATDIAKQKSGSCEIERGLYAGFVAAGTSITLDVPYGKSRSLEILAYLRTNANESCTTAKTFGALSREKIARVGKVEAFDTLKSEVTVPVQVESPASGVSVVSQYQMASSCSGTAFIPANTNRFAAGHARQTGGNYVIEASLSGVKNETVLHGGAYQMQLSRKAD